jgi:hypothetical protein
MNLSNKDLKRVNFLSHPTKPSEKEKTLTNVASNLERTVDACGINNINAGFCRVAYIRLGDKL